MSEQDTKNLDPITTPLLVGHDKAAKIFLESFQSGRLHHAWLLAGQRGIGKATLAYHLARFLLKHGTQKTGGLLTPDEAPLDFTRASLEMAADDPVFIRVASGGEGNLKIIERGYNEKTKKRRTEIVVDDVRALHDFFEMTASHNGWRIAIIDPADEMNRSAANALLKMLEEPPRKSILFLITHAKGSLVPTIRSRCQQLLLNPLSDEDTKKVLHQRMPDLAPGEVDKYAELSGGSPGYALRLSLYDGEGLNLVIASQFSGQGLNTKQVHDFAGTLGLATNEKKYFLFLDILTREIAGKIKALAETGAAKSRLDCWLKLWEKVDRILTEGEGINLGRKAMLLVLLSEMAAVGRQEHKAA
ncbi:MAG: DNA polymerase III subunit delta' [Sphingomonadales bacterium]